MTSSLSASFLHFLHVCFFLELVVDLTRAVTERTFLTIYIFVCFTLIYFLYYFCKAIKMSMSSRPKRRIVEVGRAENDTQLTKNRTFKDNIQYNMWELFEDELTFIPQGVGMSERRRACVECVGIEVETYWRTVTQNYGGPGVLALPSDIYLCNLAIIAPIARDDGGIVNTEFFRARNNLDERNVDFSTTLGSIDLHNSPINSDRYHVLKHLRFELDTFQAQSGKFNKRCSFYLPINRQLRYSGNNGFDCLDRIYMVWWVCRGFSSSGVSLGVPSMDMHYRATIHYREPVTYKEDMEEE